MAASSVCNKRSNLNRCFSSSTSAVAISHFWSVFKGISVHRPKFGSLRLALNWSLSLAALGLISNGVKMAVTYGAFRNKHQTKSPCAHFTFGCVSHQHRNFRRSLSSLITALTGKLHCPRPFCLETHKEQHLLLSTNAQIRSLPQMLFGKQPNPNFALRFL